MKNHILAFASVTISSICISSAGVLDVAINALQREVTLAGNMASVPAGTTVRLGTFADASTADGSSLDALLSTFTEFATTTVGEGAGGTAGFIRASIQLDDTVAPVMGNVPAQLAVVIGDSDDAYGALSSPDFVTAAFTDAPAPTNLTDVNFANTNIFVVGGAGSLNDTGGPVTMGATFELTAAVVPEPSTSFLLGLGLIGLISRRRR